MNIINFIFPRQCVICSEPGAYLCKTCKKKLQPHPEICPICHRFSKDYQVCINCKSEKNNFLEGIIIPFVYDELLKKLIIKMKYFHKKDISGFLVERLAIALQANQSFQQKIVRNPGLETRNKEQKKYDHVSYSMSLISRIPSHRYREYFVKGYNQSKILAKKLSKITGIPRIKIAKKKKHTKTQASLPREGRLKNLKNAFALVKNIQLQ